MRQGLGKSIPFTPSAGPPVNDDSDRVIMSGFGTGYRVKKWLLKLKFTAAGAATAEFYLWARDVPAGDWGEVGEKAGWLNGGVTISGTTAVVRFFVLENLAVFNDLYFEIRNTTGAPTAGVCSLAEFIEQGD